MGTDHFLESTETAQKCQWHSKG